MPFGLKNAPAIFQRLMDRILQNHGQYAKAYFDDIIIFSKNTAMHLCHIKSVFETLSAFNIKLKDSKCKLMSNSITFCAYKIQKNMISRDEKFVEAIARIEQPTNLSSRVSWVWPIMRVDSSQIMQPYASH